MMVPKEMRLWECLDPQIESMDPHSLCRDMPCVNTRLDWSEELQARDCRLKQ